MAKKKIDDTIENAVVDAFGDVFGGINDLKEKRSQVIGVSPKIDISLGGGIPEGSFVVLAGPPGVGKTSLALQIAAKAQKIPSKHGVRKLFYFDIEGRIKERDITGNHLLETTEDKFSLVHSKEGNILYGDKYLDIGEKLIESFPGCVFIFDSFSAICTASRKSADIKERLRDDAPLILSSFCKRISQIVGVNKSIVIGINHIIANTGPGHKTWAEASGMKVQYQADVKLRATHQEAWEVGETKIGQLIHWVCEKSAIGPPCKIESWLRYGHGIDEHKELVDLAIGCGIVKKSGTWRILTLEGFEEVKAQGDNNLRDILVAQPELSEAIYKKVKSYLLPSTV